MNLSTATQVSGPVNTILPGGAAGSTATCPSGMHVVMGTGGVITGAANGLTADGPTTDHLSWLAIGGNTSAVDGTVQAIAYCVPAGNAEAASAAAYARAVLRAHREAAAIVAKLKEAMQRGR